MRKCVFIVQGEGRGHMSQAVALKELLDEAGFSLEAVFVGKSKNGALPDYFVDCFRERIIPFHSPYFLSTPNKKGIYVGRTLLFNLLRSFSYIREIKRIRVTINSLRPDVVFNFYDVVGALALRKLDPAPERVGIGHHFFLHLKNYFGVTGIVDRHLLAWHTRLIMRSCDRVLALSYSEQPANSPMEVVPPLIRRSIREMPYRPGNRYLVYFLMEGYVYDLIRLARADAEFRADVFTGIIPGIEVPPGIRIEHPGGEKFREAMACCRGLITTAGFDTAAEAAYLGIPLAVIPVRNHFEQKCNGVDISEHGIGIMLDYLEPGVEQDLKHFDHTEFRNWVDRCGELILNAIGE